MSKKAGVISVETRQRLLQAAADEFTAHGFEGSSLRRICSAAGVTTGALYFFFAGKDDLFRAVISAVTEPFMALIRDQYSLPHDFRTMDFMDTAPAGYASCVLMQDFYEAHRQAADIVLRNMNHPAVQDFMAEFTASSKTHFLSLISAWDAVHPRQHPVDDFALEQFVHMQVDTMLTLVSRGFSREETLEHARILDKMLRAAFSALLAD